MRIAVLSGKGGAGKTFVSANMAKALNCVYIDCDVEEPNGRIFLKPTGLTTEKVHRRLPVFDSDKCDGCRKCLDFCKFNALFFIKKPAVFDEVCHSCGGCLLVCPTGAVSEELKEVGTVEAGNFGDGGFAVTGELNLGEASGIPVISKALDLGYEFSKTHSQDDLDMDVIIDCPPGSACSVTESITSADYCILVAEPTAFGLHNLKMVAELASIFEKPMGIVINKEEEEYKPLYDFCQEVGIDIVGKIPFDRDLASKIGEGSLAVDLNQDYKELFLNIRKKIDQLVDCNTGFGSVKAAKFEEIGGDF